jgi:hypothetical protein
MAECTIALIDLSKITKCVLKRDELGKLKGVRIEDVLTYIFALRIEAGKEKELREEVKRHGIKLRVCKL